MKRTSLTTRMHCSRYCQSSHRVRPNRLVSSSLSPLYCLPAAGGAGSSIVPSCHRSGARHHPIRAWSGGGSIGGCCILNHHRRNTVVAAAAAATGEWHRRRHDAQHHRMMCMCSSDNGDNANADEESSADLLSSSSSSSAEISSTSPQRLGRKRVAIVGGGLAGLSLCYHLLSKTVDAAAPHARGNQRRATSKDHEASSHNRHLAGVDITIFDTASRPGVGGASSVAGGLLHPFSPRGKLVHLGLEGLHAANRLIEHAARHEPTCVLRDRLYRLAISESHVAQLKQTAALYPDMATWQSRDEVIERIRLVGGNGGDGDDDRIMIQTSSSIMGGLELSRGCRVVHVPTYLVGLWKECQRLAALHLNVDSGGRRDGGSGEAATRAACRWKMVPSREQAQHQPHNGLLGEEGEQREQHAGGSVWEGRLRQFDTVIFSAGSGLWQGPDAVFQNSPSDHRQDAQQQQPMLHLPVKLVRGQSVEIALDDDGTNKPLNEALLCGKYVAPMPTRGRVLLGATHEYKSQALSRAEVEAELKRRSYAFAPHVWERGRVDEVTAGWRVQSNRGKFGRLPIIGRLHSSDIIHHPDAWLFTGLSSRGLLHHGIFGDILSDAILDGDEGRMFQLYPELDWWRRDSRKD